MDGQPHDPAEDQGPGMEPGPDQPQYSGPVFPPIGTPQSGGFPAAPAYPVPTPGLPYHPSEPQFGRSMARPGTATAAAVLAFVQAGLTLVTSVLIVVGVSTFADPDEPGADAVGLLLLVAQFAGVVLLLLGGLRLINGTSRVVLIVGTALELAISATYLIVFAFVPVETNEDAGAKAVLMFGAALFAVMPLISLILACGRTVSEYLRVRRGR